MKATPLVCLAILFLLDRKVFSKSSNSVLSDAFANITKALADSCGDLSMLYITSEKKSINSAICHRSFANGVPFTVRHTGTNGDVVKMDNSAIVSVESIDELIDFNENVVLTNNYSKPFQFFIHCDGATIDELSKLEENDQTKAIFQFEYFVVDQGELIRLMTFVWHTATACNQPQLVEVNRFSKKERKWKTDEFRLNKFENFHGCTLLFNFQPRYPDFVFGYRGDELGEDTICGGFLCDASEAIASNLNFEIKMKVSLDLCTFKSDFCWRCLPSVIASNQKPFFTQVFLSFDDHIAVPPPESYNGYEKLLLPFDDATWFWIVMTFSFLFGAIFVLQFSKPFVKDFVFGRNVTAPVLTVLRAFFGISNPRTPGRNFARFLLMLVVIFSLIVRTVYQGKMFEFLQKKMLKPQVKSIKDMIDKNYTFYVSDGFTSVFDKENYFGQCTVIEIKPPTSFTSVLKVVEQKPGSKVAAEVPHDMLPTLLAKTNGRFMNRILNDRVLLDMKVLAVERHNKLFDLIDRKMQQLFEGGLIHHFISTFEDYLDRRRYEAHKEPGKALSFNELEAGFVICFVPLLFCIAIFILEWLVVLKSYIVFRGIFEGFFKLQRDLLNVQAGNLQHKISGWQEIVDERESQIS